MHSPPQAHCSCTGILGVVLGIQTSQVLRLTCTLLTASQKNPPGVGRVTLKLLERATLAKIDVECHPPNNAT